MALTIDRIGSPIGEILLVCEEAALVALDFQDFEERLYRDLGRRHRGLEVKPGAAARSIREPIRRYFDGDRTALDRIPVRAGGTPFQERVWAALRRIPFGETVSYGTLARRLQVPRAYRAVGLANGSNPISIVVPCHRVIGSDGTLTGYGGGLERKRWLLQHEGVAAFALEAQAAVA
jgi:methylated-DNA-[protein]-cysteine S-methyltransferase